MTIGQIKARGREAKHSKRYKRRDSAASAKREARKLAGEKTRQQRTKSKG